MTAVIIVIGLLVITVFIYLATLDGDYRVDRSLLINAPIGEVYQAVVDFKTWPEWSPWLLHEPDTRLEYSDNYQQVGGYYNWDGKLVGAGKLTHLELQENHAIEQRIEFLRPFKSTSSVGWRFEDQGGQTRVHWIMQGRMPFFFRVMTKMMTGMIAKDYDLGLHLLNGYLNKDNPHPKITFVGEQQLDPFVYLCKPFKGYVEEMIEAMQKGFPELKQQAGDDGIIFGKPSTIYHKADPQKMYFECDMAVPVKESAGTREMKSSHFTGGRYFKVELKGDYQFLELAWYKAYSHMQMAKLKVDKKRPSMEVYENDPESVKNESELQTSIYVPIR